MRKKEINSICYKVKTSDAEKIRRLLLKKNLLKEYLYILKNKFYVYFPIKKVTNDLNSYELTDKKFEIKVNRINSYKDMTNVPEKIKKLLPTSFDRVGDIILIKLNQDSTKYKTQIGNALLEINKSIKTVYNVKSVSGEFRTRDIELIAGLDKTTTLHKEFGLSLRVDVSKTYFSPRLANERNRISTIVKNDEVVLDMFTGVAPFSIMIARYANPKIVYSVDKNKNAIKYALENVRLNKVLDKIQLLNIDAEKVSKYVPEKVDRIIMNLPFSSFSFFRNALEISKNISIIHYYDILKIDEIDKRIIYLEKEAKKYNYQIKINKIRKIKSYSPREFYIGMDITATKMPT